MASVMKELSKWHEKNEIHSWTKIGNDKETFFFGGGGGETHHQGSGKKPLLMQPGLWKHEIDVLHFIFSQKNFLIINCDALHYLVPFVQFKKRENHPPATLGDTPPLVF